MLRTIPIHVINLKRRTDRKEKIIKEFEKCNITNYTFFDAISQEDVTEEDMKDNGKDFCRELRKGEYGCYLSHLGVFNKILNSQDELHLILEDDAFFVQDFENKFNYILIKIKNTRWDIFYLGINCYWDECKQGIFVGSKSDGIYYPKVPIWGTHAYLIKKQTVKNIIDYLTPIRYPFDVALMGLNIKKLTLIDTIVKVHNSDSDTV